MLENQKISELKSEAKAAGVRMMDFAVPDGETSLQVITRARQFLDKLMRYLNHMHTHSHKHTHFLSSTHTYTHVCALFACMFIYAHAHSVFLFSHYHLLQHNSSKFNLITL